METITISRAAYIKACNFASNDKSQGSLTGVLIDFNECKIVATNGHAIYLAHDSYLAEQKVEPNYPKGGIVISAKKIKNAKHCNQLSLHFHLNLAINAFDPSETFEILGQKSDYPEYRLVVEQAAKAASVPAVLALNLEQHNVVSKALGTKILSYNYDAANPRELMISRDTSDGETIVVSPMGVGDNSEIELLRARIKGLEAQLATRLAA